MENEMDAAERGGRRSLEERRRLGRRVREAREYLGLSQEFVAAHAGLAASSLAAIELGRRDATPDQIERLFRLLKIPPAALEAEDGGSAPPPDPTVRALFRAARSLSDQDREQVVRFAEFLREAGPAPVRSPAADE